MFSSVLQLTKRYSQGFASGDLDEDGWALQHFLAQDLELCIAQSFSKNFGLYSERVGALHVKTQSIETSVHVQGMLEQLVRSDMTTPPAYGARIVGKVLNDEILYAQWVQDLQSMSSRMQHMRQALHTALLKFGAPGDWEHILKNVSTSTDLIIRCTSDGLTDWYVLVYGYFA